MFRRKLILSLTGCALLIGCGDSKKDNRAVPAFDLAAEAKKEAAAQKREIRDLFNMKSKALEYSYNSVGKRDPFKEFTGSSQLIQMERGGPLTTFDLSQMKLVAVIWGISSPRGMVQLPDGKSYIIKRNSPIGRHYGKVARITPDSVVVEEEFRGSLGELQVKETKLFLHKETTEIDTVAGAGNSQEAKK